MDLRIFLSVLLVYRSNFHLLHWMAKGEEFFRIHELASNYYEELLKDADVIAEMILRRGHKIVNYKEALDLITTLEDYNFLLLDSDHTYDIEEFVEYSRKMLDTILECIEELLASEEIQQPKNVGIKSSLEGMHDKYDLQCNYLLKRYKK